MFINSVWFRILKFVLILFVIELFFLIHNKSKLPCHNQLIDECFFNLIYIENVQIKRFSWSMFSHLWSDLKSKSPYSVRIWNNADQKNLHLWHLSSRVGFANNDIRKEISVIFLKSYFIEQWNISLFEIIWYLKISQT